MATIFRCLGLLVVLFHIPALSQSTNAPPVDNENALLSALLSAKTADESTALALLRDNKKLVTRHLYDELIRAATMSSALGNPARSLLLCEIAKEAATQLDDKKLLAFVFYKIGRFHFEQDQLKAAIEEYLQSKKLFEEARSPRDLIYILSELGTLHIYAADYKKAREYSEESLALATSLKDSDGTAGALPDEHGMAFAWSNLGIVAKWEGDYRIALENFEKSLVLWKELKRRGYWSAGNIVDALASMGHVHQAMGNHVQALTYLSQAMEIAKTLINNGRVAALLNDMGVLYIEQGDYLRASEFLNKSLQIFIGLNNRREVARNLLNIGVINQRQGNYQTAIEKFQESLKRAEDIDAIEIVIAAQEGLGSTCQAQGDYTEALKWFDEAWSRAQAIGDKIRMTEILWRKGQVAYSQKEYVRSGELAGKAAALATQLRLPLMSYLSLTLKGKAYQAQKAGVLASEYFLAAIEAVERLRAQVAGGEKEQQLFFEDKLSPYHEMISLFVQQNSPQQALKYAERAKARVLLDVLRNGRVEINRSLSQKEQLEERRLYGEMVSLNTQIRAERIRQQPDEAWINELGDRLQNARKAYEAFQASLYTKHPELRARRGLFPQFEMKDAVALIPDARTALLEYVVTDEQTFLFVLTRSSTEQAKLNVRIYSIGIKRRDLSHLVEDFRKLLAINHPGFRQPGERLYEILVKPAEQELQGKSTVCIVPDGLLWDMPFQALQDGAGKYMLELYAIYYAPSLQVLGEMKKRAANLRSSFVRSGYGDDASLRGGQVGPELFAIGNPTITGEVLARAQAIRNSPFVSLPETEKEVQTIGAEVYGPKASSIHIGTAAREDVVKAEMGKYRVIHLATHGVLNDRSPLYSYLLLAPSEDAREDGLLEAWELMQMDLNAEMVVLSACDTARGYVSTGEGIIGMTWALSVAGVPTTVASQWEVPSESTTKLMVAFHKNANAMDGPGGKKASKAQAWRQAALEMIKDPRYRMKPFYWAGFVVVGDGGI